MNKCILKILVAIMTSTSASLALADVYKIDTKESSVSWKGTKKVGSAHLGTINLKEGDVTVDKKNNVTAANVVIDMATIANNDLKDSPEYQKKLVGHLSSEDFFNVAKFPTSTFKMTGIKAGKAKGEVVVNGQLTMIGATHPVEFPATLSVEKGTVTGQGKLMINRTTWGLKYGSGNFFKELAGDKIINDEFELDLKIVAKK